MALRGTKHKTTGTWKRVGVFGLLFFGVLILSNSVRKVYIKHMDAEKTLAHMQEEVTSLKERDAVLRSALTELQTNDGLAFELRKKLNVSKAGEQVAIIVNPAESTSTIPFVPSLWEKIKNLFR